MSERKRQPFVVDKLLAPFLSAIEPTLNDSLQQWRDNLRLRIGVWAIVFILLFFIVLWLGDLGQEVHRQYLQVHNRLAKVEAIQQQSEWPERLIAEQRVQKDLLSQLRASTSESLARASLQSELEAVARDIELKQSRINITQPVLVGEVAGQRLYKVSGELRGGLQKSNLLKLVERLSQERKLQQVEHFDIEFSRNRRCHLIVSAYFVIGEKQ